MLVLYAKDEPGIRQMTEFALEDEGFELLSSTSGHEALSKATDISPELIWVDVMMPGIDGPDALQKNHVDFHTW